jgi:hypothetical protein
MEPAELQILKQALGDERGQFVFAANLMASSLAQLSQQVREQASQIEQMQQLATEPQTDEAAPAGANPWTGANGAVHEPLEAVKEAR